MTRCSHSNVDSFKEITLHYSTTKNTILSVENLCSTKKSDATLCYTTPYFLLAKCQRFPSHFTHFIHLSYLSFSFFTKTWKTSWKLMFTIPDWNSTLPVENSPKTPHGIRIHWNLPVGQEFTWTHCISAKPALAAVINSNLTLWSCRQHAFLLNVSIYKRTKQADRGMKPEVFAMWHLSDNPLTHHLPPFWQFHQL